MFISVAKGCFGFGGDMMNFYCYVTVLLSSSLSLHIYIYIYLYIWFRVAATSETHTHTPTPWVEVVYAYYIFHYGENKPNFYPLQCVIFCYYLDGLLFRSKYLNNNEPLVSWYHDNNVRPYSGSNVCENDNRKTYIMIC